VKSTCALSHEVVSADWCRGQRRGLSCREHESSLRRGNFVFCSILTLYWKKWKWILWDHLVILCIRLYLSVYPSVRLCLHLSVSVCVCPSVCVSVCVCPSLFVSVRVRPSVRESIPIFLDLWGSWDHLAVWVSSVSTPNLLFSIRSASYQRKLVFPRTCCLLFICALYRYYFVWCFYKLDEYFCNELHVLATKCLTYGSVFRLLYKEWLPFRRCTRNLRRFDSIVQGLSIFFNCLENSKTCGKKKCIGHKMCLLLFGTSSAPINI
jgi:hypothetical protein